MHFLSADAGSEAARIHWLIRLRWVAVAGVFSVVTVTGPLLDVVPHYAPLLVLVLVLLSWNLVLSIRERRSLPLQPAGSQVTFDLFLLGLLLFFSGGVRNPFCVFLVVQVILAAILLPRAVALNRGLFGASLLVALSMIDALGFAPKPPPALIGDGSFLGAGSIVLWGLTPALLITIAVSLHFTTTIMSDLRARAREAQHYLEQAERERRNLRDVVRSLGAGLVVTDGALRVDWQNHQAEAIVEDLIQDGAVHFDDGWPDRQRLDEGETQTREWQGPDEQGRPRLYQVSAAPVHGEGGRLAQVSLLFADVTERRAATQQLQRTEKLAALGRLAAGVAHEIATPLGSVNILASEARTTLAAGPLDDAGREEVDGYLRDLRGEVGRISGLVRQLLDLSHPGDGSPELLDIPRAVDEAIRLVAMRSSSVKGRIRSETASELPKVRTAPDRVLQVLLNVLDNAVDATAATEGRIVVRTHADPDAIEISIADEGDGIDAEDLDRVFDPFFTTKDVGEGTGLGLYVTYEIMKNLGGDISIESTVGVGTTVRLRLPLPAATD